jgi:hypothetical protein
LRRVTVGLVVRVHDQHRPRRARSHVGGHAVGQPGAELAVAVGADDDQACLVLIRCRHDRLPGGRALDRNRHRAESCRLGQRCAVLGGLLGGVPDVVGARGVKLRPRRWHEPDAERPPHREDYRIAPAGQLLTRLRDRLSGQVGAVISQQHRPGAVAVVTGRAPERTAGQGRG